MRYTVTYLVPRAGWCLATRDKSLSESTAMREHLEALNYEVKMTPTGDLPRCCGVVLPDGVGKYGCPNCEGDQVARIVTTPGHAK